MMSYNTKMRIFILTATLITIYSCSSPGISSPESKISFSGKEYLKKDSNYVEVTKVNQANIDSINSQLNSEYEISSGDKLNVTVWGLPEAFPVTNFGGIDNPMSTRTVSSDGTIFFPYTGLLNLEGLNINQARTLITSKLSESFVDPQVDITIVEFNESRTIYIVGEILVPSTFKIGIEPFTLMDAIGRSKGLNPNTSSAEEVYVMRGLDEDPQIFRIDLRTSDKLLLAHQFNLKPKDVIYVGPSNITKWNRVVTQLFPFSSFLNQVDLIQSRD